MKFHSKTPKKHEWHKTLTSQNCLVYSTSGNVLLQYQHGNGSSPECCLSCFEWCPFYLHVWVLPGALFEFMIDGNWLPQHKHLNGFAPVWTLGVHFCVNLETYWTNGTNTTRHRKHRCSYIWNTSKNRKLTTLLPECFSHCVTSDNQN